MKNYSLLSHKSWQMIKKYCVDLDSNIQTLQHYIDFKNPNYIILNYVYNNQNEENFYSVQNLIDLEICRTDENLAVTGINIDKLYAGQIIYNNFGTTLSLYNNNILLDITLLPGFALFKMLSLNPSFLIIALDSEGDFYIISNIEKDGTVIFKNISHATASYGLYYLFSMVADNARWVFRNNTIDYLSCYKPNNWQGFTLMSWSWDEEHEERDCYITTKYGTLWTVTSTISNEIMSSNGVSYEEIGCDCWTETYSKGIDKGSVSFYSINTNMNDEIGRLLNLGVYLY